MSDDNKKTEPAEQEGKAAELTEKDLEQVAGGAGTTTPPPRKDKWVGGF